MANKLFCLRIQGELMAWVDGKAVELAPSLKVINHSPTGFEIGYGGSGPAQLALAVLMRFADKKTAATLHQDFKWEFLADAKYQAANLPADEPVSIYVDIPAWIQTKKAEMTS